MTRIDPVIAFQRIGDHELPLPSRGSDQAAGLDLRTLYPFELPPRHRALLQTGFAVEIPDGYVGRISPRSGLAMKGVDVMAGVIDADYRGEVKVLLINHGFETLYFEEGDRIAQLVIHPVCLGQPCEVGQLSGTERGEGGFGSTGVK